MNKYDLERPSKDDSSGCRCSTAVGFLLVLLAAAVAVGVGIIVHFAGNRDADVTCKFNVTGMIASNLAKDSCIAQASKNDREICSVCPDPMTTAAPATTTSMMYTTSSTGPVTYDARLPVTLKPVAYTIYIRPDFYSNNVSDFMFYGRSSVHVTCEAATSEIVMHLKDLHLADNSITVQEDNSAENLYMSHQLVDGPQFIVIKTASSLVKGRNYRITFSEFSAPVRDDFTGLYRGTFTENGVDSHYVMTQMQVVEARKVFPCFDEPAMKATFQLTVARQPNMVTISNSPLAQSQTNAEGWVEETFDVTPIMPTYLLAIIVGDFVYSEKMSANNIRTRVYSKPSAQNQTAYALDVGARILTALENYFDIPFPIPKQDQIAINAFQFGAMENWGAIVYFEDVVLYDVTMTSYRNKYMIAHVISHEISHNWFGNLVSPAWWDDLWLNEGFATFVTFNGLHAVHPEWNVEEWFVSDIVTMAMKVDGLKSSHPIYIPGVEDPDEILQYFDEISYDKGASVIRMVEYVLGKETFKRGLKNYLTTLSFGNARHQDLFQALSDQAVAENNTIDIQKFLSPWIYQMGFPVVNVEYKEAGKIRLSQERFVFSKNATDPGIFTSDYGFKWTIPFTYTSSHMTNFTVSQEDIVMMRPDETSVHISSDTIPEPTGDNWVVGNLKYMGFFTVNYDERNWNAIMKQLTTDHTVIDPLNRLQIIIDAWNLVESGDLDITIALKTFDYISMETQPAHLNEIMYRIESLHSLLFRLPVYGAFSTYMKHTWTTLYNKVGFSPAGPTDPMMPIRSSVTSLACYYGSEDCVNQATSIFAEWMANPEVRPAGMSANNLKAIYCTGVMYGGEAEWNFLRDRYENETFYIERGTLLAGLSCTTNAFLMTRYLELGLSPVVVAREKTSVGLYASLNGMAQSVVWDFYRSHYDDYQSQLGTYWNMYLLNRLAQSFTTTHRLAELQQLGAEKHLDAYSNYRKSLEKTEGNVQWVKENGPVIKRWLASKNVHFVDRNHL